MIHRHPTTAGLAPAAEPAAKVTRRAIRRHAAQLEIARITAEAETASRRGHGLVGTLAPALMALVDRVALGERLDAAALPSLED